MADKNRPLYNPLMHLYLIRHGQSFGNLPTWTKEKDGWDVALTPLGEQQAAALAKHLPSEVPSVDKIYCSTLIRAKQTAEPLAKHYDIDVEYSDLIRELGHNGLDYVALPEEEIPMWNEIPPGTRPFAMTGQTEPSESWMSFRGRIGLFLDGIMQTDEGQTVLVVCHGGTISAFIDNILNVPPIRGALINTVNTGVLHFEFLGNDKPVKWYWRWTGWWKHFADVDVS